MKKILFLPFVILAACTNNTQKDSGYKTREVREHYAAGIIGLDFKTLRANNPDIKIFIDNKPFDGNVYTAKNREEHDIRLCDDTKNICTGFTWIFATDEGVATLPSPSWLFDAQQYTFHYTDQAENSFCAGKTNTKRDIYGIILNSLQYCLQPYPEKGIALTDMRNIVFPEDAGLLLVERDAANNRSIKTAVELYKKYYLYYGGIGDQGFYLCMNRGDLISDGINFVEPGKITQVGLSNLMPALKAFSKPGIKYECMAVDRFKYDTEEYLNQTDECVLERRRVPEKSDICYFNYKKYLPQNTKINTDKQFLNLVETYHNLHKAYAPEKMVNFQCETKKEITTTEREQCRKDEKKAQEKLAKEYDKFLEQISTNSVPLCKKKDSKKYQQFLKDLNVCQNHSSFEKPAKDFEYKNFCSTAGLSEDVANFYNKYCLPQLRSQLATVSYAKCIESGGEKYRYGVIPFSYPEMLKMCDRLADCINRDSTAVKKCYNEHYYTFFSY